ncbi:hypothetical protein FZO89_05215 [Luteimonas viscosa]|uniref:Uncharacterized protein n=1 Tax=Luteimonas viscosa TaxID=1132694 RepID=A0A5D4XP45_9GAMM|nr:hypothetical protein [Luteimonas viscosa]TYT25703.1 hypothetical protein FZO89_05215 [Luteimonas viscosa]
MHTETILLLCALHSFGFALFHLAFWRLFGWPRTLENTTRPNRAILQIANVQLVWIFIAIGLSCLLYPAELASSPLGRALLAAMAGFWAIRTGTQFVWLRIRHPLVHTLTASFVLGAVLFAWPLLG